MARRHQCGIRSAECRVGKNHSTLRSPHSPGVCALGGIGGAGKTAIAERFLRVLPGGLPETEGIAKDDTLPPSRALFVFSFYDAPNPDHFFTQLYAWLTGTPLDESAKAPSYQQTLRLLESVGTRSTASHSSLEEVRDGVESVPTLLLLDGLEKVQDDGARGGAFGQLLDGRLRDLILRAADGWLPGVALLITTRFRLFDPLAERSALYRQIDIVQLQSPATLARLHARDCQNRPEFTELCDWWPGASIPQSALCTPHSYGDPSRLPPLAEVKVPDEAAADDPRLAAVKEQERKFGRLAQRYRTLCPSAHLVHTFCSRRKALSCLLLSRNRTGCVAERPPTSMWPPTRD